MNYLLIIISIILSSFGQLAMKNGANEISLQDGAIKLFIQFTTNLSILSGLLMYGLSTIVWIVALSRIQLSIAYPLVSLSYIIVVILSYFIFNEPLSLQKILGLVFIIIGVIFIARS
ncbi:EamA family transporter [Paenibacillus sp. SYP-B3998]|uniref:EamA family transporter n=1 Tax=Paenibacillus sp. SYP-B3998 TaxID=2678564 RepID=UPI0031F7F740